MEKQAARNQEKDSTDRRRYEVYEYIKERYLNSDEGAYEPVPVSQRDFKRDLRMSQKDLRECLKRLEEDDMIASVPPFGRRPTSFWVRV